MSDRELVGCAAPHYSIIFTTTTDSHDSETDVSFGAQSMSDAWKKKGRISGMGVIVSVVPVTNNEITNSWYGI